MRAAYNLAIGLLLITVACALWAQGVATRNAAAVPRAAGTVRPFPVTFTDVAVLAGLTTPSTSGNEQIKKYIIEANGSGVAFVDFDHDGWLDVFLVNGSRLEGFPPGQEPTNHLYRNDRHGRFADVTRAAGLAQSGWGNGVCAGDFDNDGYTDLYVTYWGTNRLYRNTGQGAFTDVTSSAAVGGTGKQWSSGCTFFDYDRDGKLDLFVTRYQQFDLATAPLPGKSATCEWKGQPVFCGPRGLPYGSVALYHNEGDGHFKDVTAAAGLAQATGFYAFTPVAADLTGDGWPDLFIACDSTPSLFFRNNRNGTFSELGTETGLAFNEHGFEQGGMGVAVGDIDGDGRLDLIKTNFAGDYPNVYLNRGKGIFEDIVAKAGLAVNPQYVGWGIGLADFDNDGWLDALQVNGHVYPELDTRGGAERYRNPRLVYRNLGRGQFEDVSALAGPAIQQLFSSRGAAFGDFDNDGRVDALVMNMGAPPSLLRNNEPRHTGQPGAHWIELLLQGTKSNRSAIGAEVMLAAGQRQQTAAVLSQSSYVSQNDFRLHFGLGAAARVESIVVRWPNGASETFPGTAADAKLLLVEGSGRIVPQEIAR